MVQTSELRKTPVNYHLITKTLQEIKELYHTWLYVDYGLHSCLPHMMKGVISKRFAAVRNRRNELHEPRMLEFANCYQICFKATSELYREIRWNAPKKTLKREDIDEDTHPSAAVVKIIQRFAENDIAKPVRLYIKNQLVYKITGDADVAITDTISNCMHHFLTIKVFSMVSFINRKCYLIIRKDSL